MDSNTENHTSLVHRSAAAVISNNVLAERLQERIQTLAEEHPELFISKEEAEAVGYRAEDEKNKTHFLTSLRKSYTDARYTQNYTYDDFHKLYEFVKKQVKVLEYHLQPPQKNTITPQMEIDL